MKKVLSISTLVLLFFFVSSKDSFAQQFKLSLGPITGLNFNIITGSDLNQSFSGLGILFGAQVDMKFSPVLGLLTQVQFYDNKSGSNSETGTIQQLGIQGTVDTDLSLAYFMIEPLLKLCLPNTGMYFLVGPAIGFNIEGSTTTTITPVGNFGGQQQQFAPQKASLKEYKRAFCR